MWWLFPHPSRCWCTAVSWTWSWQRRWPRGSWLPSTGPAPPSTRKPPASTGRCSPATPRWRVTSDQWGSFTRWADVSGALISVTSPTPARLLFVKASLLITLRSIPLLFLPLTQVIIRGGGHILPYDQPARSFDMIDRFLSTQDWKWKDFSPSSCRTRRWWKTLDLKRPLIASASKHLNWI